LNKRQIHKLCLIVFSLCFFFIFTLSCKRIQQQNKNSTSHTLSIVHPGDPNEKVWDLELIENKDENGNPTEYSLWVDSVICRDKKCAIVKIQLVWDAFGRYQRYTVEKGEELTKLDHIPFTAKDHEKLQNILKDKKSPLSEVTKEGLTRKKPAGVDGVSGATTLTLSSTVVVGAGYTCYDLWHWANGEVEEIIRDTSGKNFDAKTLTSFLDSKDSEKTNFALNYLKERKIYEQESIDAVVKSMKTADDVLIGPVLKYLKGSGSLQKYYSSLIQIFTECSSHKRVFIINSLTKEKNIPQGFYNRLSASLPSCESHHELQLFLTMIEEHQAHSSEIAKNTATLMNHKKFFIARRAYWYLKKQKLSPTLQKEVDLFTKKFEDRL
jgi:hypothetical protein